MQTVKSDKDGVKETAINCHVHALATLRADQQKLKSLRSNPEPLSGISISPTLLKYADDQTVAALVVVIRAISRLNEKIEEFNAWGVVASSNYFGRTFSAHAIQRYVREGAWGITPHTVPHHSLHAISGTISQTFNMQGPNYGLGGGARAEVEGFLAAAPLVHETSLPGVWLIMTGHFPEQIPLETEENKNCPADCLAVALALSTEPKASAIARVSVTPAASPSVKAAEFRLNDFVRHLESIQSPSPMCWRLPWGGTVLWQSSPATKANLAA